MSMPTYGSYFTSSSELGRYLDVSEFALLEEVLHPKNTEVWDGHRMFLHSNGMYVSPNAFTAANRGGISWDAATWLALGRNSAWSS